MKWWKLLLHFVFLIFTGDYISSQLRLIYKIKKVIRFGTDFRNILMWTQVHNFEEGQKEFVMRRCEHINCLLTTNRSMFNNLGYFDAVLFDLQGVSGGSHDLPSLRSEMQKYIFVANDSADNYPICDDEYESFFNWTWTYKLESTIPYSFISVRNKYDDNIGFHSKWIANMTPIHLNLKRQLLAKSKATAIFLDNCNSRSKRELYIKNLRRHLATYGLSVDVFGACGEKQCKRKSMNGCHWRLQKQYYFYLAMEDSLSDQYITKEVLYGYENNAVPIVYGGAEYSRILPPNSYLNAMQLDEENMAATIHRIIINKTLYYDMFRWRNHYTIKESPVLNPCELCSALNNEIWQNFKIKQVDFRKWWNNNYKDRCGLKWFRRYSKAANLL